MCLKGEGQTTHVAVFPLPLWWCQSLTSPGRDCLLKKPPVEPPPPPRLPPRPHPAHPAPTLIGKCHACCWNNRDEQCINRWMNGWMVYFFRIGLKTRLFHKISDLLLPCLWHVFPFCLNNSMCVCVCEVVLVWCILLISTLSLYAPSVVMFLKRPGPSQMPSIMTDMHVWTVALSTKPDFQDYNCTVLWVYVWAWS